jgi:hypothetical protein
MKKVSFLLAIVLIATFCFSLAAFADDEKVERDGKNTRSFLDVAKDNNFDIRATVKEAIRDVLQKHEAISPQNANMKSVMLSFLKEARRDAESVGSSKLGAAWLSVLQGSMSGNEKQKKKQLLSKNLDRSEQKMVTNTDGLTGDLQVTANSQGDSDAKKAQKIKKHTDTIAHMDSQDGMMVQMLFNSSMPMYQEMKYQNNKTRTQDTMMRTKDTDSGHATQARPNPSTEKPHNDLKPIPDNDSKPHNSDYDPKY